MPHDASAQRVRIAPALFLRLPLLATCLMMSVLASASSPPVPLASSRSITTSDGVNLHVFVSDAPKVPTAQVLVFVPGWTMPADLFTAQINHFAARYRVVALDPRGQGRSDVPAAGYTLERRAQDIAEVLAGLDLTNVVLVGWSLGVLESLHLSTTSASGRIAAYVLVDNSVGEATPPKGDPNFFPNLRSKRSETVDRFVRGMFKSSQPPSFLAHVSQHAQRMSVEQSIALLSYPKPREYWRESLYAIPKPVAYFVTPKFFAQADAVKATRPATFIQKFPNAGHAVFVDEATAFNAALTEFLKQLP